MPSITNFLLIQLTNENYRANIWNIIPHIEISIKYLPEYAVLSHFFFLTPDENVTVRSGYLYGNG
jgi:hypothetical protein